MRLARPFPHSFQDYTAEAAGVDIPGPVLSTYSVGLSSGLVGTSARPVEAVLVTEEVARSLFIPCVWPGKSLGGHTVVAMEVVEGRGRVVGTVGTVAERVRAGVGVAELWVEEGGGEEGLVEE